MTNHEIDNSIENLGNVVLWQYDNAYHLLLVLRLLEDMYNACIANFWDFWREGVLSIKNCSSFGAIVWGVFLGVQRPTITVVENGIAIERCIDTYSYKKYLHAMFMQMKSTGSFDDLVEFCSVLFSTDGANRKIGVRVVDNLDMSVSYEKTEYFELLTYDQQKIFEQLTGILPYPLGIKSNTPVPEEVFGFDGQQNSLYETNKEYEAGDYIGHIESDGTHYVYECREAVSVSENTSWENVANKFSKTMGGDPFVGGFCETTTQGPFVNLDGDYPGNTYLSYNLGPGIIFYLDGHFGRITDSTKFKPKNLIDWNNNRTWDNLLKNKEGSFIEFFPNSIKDIKHFEPDFWYVAFWSIFEYDNKFWQVVKYGIPAKKTFSELRPYVEEVNVNTTFICECTENLMDSDVMEGVITFYDRLGNVVKTWNGLKDESVTRKDLANDFSSLGALLVSANKIKVNLDVAAEAEGKTIHTTATIGDIVRYLNGSIY